MEISSVALPPVEAEPAALFVALELSKSTWLVALHSPAADKGSRPRLEGGDVEGLLTLSCIAFSATATSPTGFWMRRASWSSASAAALRRTDWTPPLCCGR
jgi:hypothetical protein